jgi:hypothetical protein
MDYLALEVTKVHYIGIDQTYATYTGCGEVERYRGSKSTGTHYEHTRIHYLFLSLHTYILKKYMARITLNLLFC